MKKNKKKKNNNKKKRAPDPPGYLRPNSFVPRAPKGTHAGEGSLASEKVSLPMSIAVYVNHGRRLTRISVCMIVVRDAFQIPVGS